MLVFCFVNKKLQPKNKIQPKILFVKKRSVVYEDEKM